MAYYLCKIADIGETGKEVSLDGNSTRNFIMLFPHAGTFRAFINVCPHQGRSLNHAPDQFLFSPEKLLVCSHHGARFELDSGECVDGPCRGARLRPVKISLSGDSVWLDQELD